MQQHLQQYNLLCVRWAEHSDRLCQALLLLLLLTAFGNTLQMVLSTHQQHMVSTLLWFGSCCHRTLCFSWWHFVCSVDSPPQKVDICMQHEISKDAYNRLTSTPDAKGRKIEVIKVPTPYPLFRTYEEAAGVHVSYCSSSWLCPVSCPGCNITVFIFCSEALPGGARTV